LTATIGSENSAHKYINLELHEFGHKAGESIVLSFGTAKLDQNVFAFEITEIFKTLAELFG
jgi:hypothetical protein